MNRFQKISAIAFSALAVGLLFSCGGEKEKGVSEKSESAQNVANSIIEGGEFVFGVATELNNFDPFTSITADVRGVNFNIFEGLVKVASDGSFEGAIADSYKVSEDAKVYTFHIREGVQFHNGKALEEKDILYSVQKAIDKKFAGYSEIQEFGMKDDNLVIVLNQADAGFVAYLTNAIVPADYDNHALEPIGTGPFKLTEYKEQDHVTLEKNEAYWGEKAHLDKVVIKFVASQANLVISFQSGAIDGFSAEAGTVMQLDENAITKYQSNSNAVQLIALNNDFEPFKDARVRQALNYLVDRKEIVDTVNYGYGVITGSALIPALSKYYDDTLSSSYTVDVEKAKELLSQAGYPNGFKFTITVPSSYTVHVDTASVVVNQLAKAGITADIKQVDWATWLSNVYKGRQYEATIISLDGSLAYPTAFLSRYVSSAKNNFMNFKSSSYDDIYAKAISTIDEDEKEELFKSAQKILSNEAAGVYIQDISEFAVYNKNFAGYKGYPLYARDFSAIYKVAK